MVHDKTRTGLLNFLAERYSLQRYLEIGVQNPAQNFNKIKCPYKVSVDPDPAAGATFCMTSDEFFHRYWTDQQWLEENELPGWSPDLVFIDGLHTAEQVKQDFKNALRVLSPWGIIILHDCNPLKEEHTIVPRPTPTGHWNGDVYRFAASLLHKGKRTVDIDNGCMVVPNGDYQVLYEPLSAWTWDIFDKSREHALNLISWDEFIASHSHV